MDTNIPLSSPPTALTANVDTLFTFSQVVEHVFIQNNSSVNITVDFDTPATSGSIVIKAGTYAYFDLRVTTVHILSSSATNVNGSSGSNIVLKGWV